MVGCHLIGKSFPGPVGALVRRVASPPLPQGQDRLVPPQSPLPDPTARCR